MDIGTRIGRHRQHRQWGGVRSTIEVPMLPMPAYEGAYVTLLTKTWSAYVPMCFFLVYPSGQNPGSQAKPLGKSGSMGKFVGNLMDKKRPAGQRRHALPGTGETWRFGGKC